MGSVESCRGGSCRVVSGRVVSWLVLASHVAPIRLPLVPFHFDRFRNHFKLRLPILGLPWVVSAREQSHAHGGAVSGTRAHAGPSDTGPPKVQSMQRFSLFLFRGTLHQNA